MKKFLTVIFSIVLFASTGFIFYLNVKLYYRPTFASEAPYINTDIINQLHFLKSTIHNGAATTMQQAYPEGFVFTQAVYGLSWCEVAARLEHRTALYKEAIHEISYASEQLSSSEGQGGFDSTLAIPFGAYYAGWSNYLLGKKLTVQLPHERDTAAIKHFKQVCAQIDSALQQEVYPESYSGFSWPADVFVAAASLQLHDQLFEPLYRQSLHLWIERVKKTTDQNGFIPYDASVDGTPQHIARGSSESLILNFLIDIDPAFANQQFALYQKAFLDYRFGLPGIREFPKGNDNTGDVDSGPVILSMGSAATIVGIRVLALYNDSTRALAVRNGIEAFGLAYTGENEKKYLLGQWPMADVFIAWAHTTEMTKEQACNTSKAWRLQFQLYSLIILSILFWSLRLLLRLPNKMANY